MAEFTVEVEPEDVGLDTDRLDRIDRHFRRYVDDGKLPGWLISVARLGKVAHLSAYGRRDVEAGLPVETDTLWRIYSMTKPVTSVAAMMLYEEGAFELQDPVSRYLPAFADMRVLTGGSAAGPRTEPATEPIRVWHLLTHTAGLTYGWFNKGIADALYRQAGFEWGQPDGCDLATACDVWAGLPLAFQPGDGWGYSVATDVLGRLVEVISGQTLDDFFASRIFGPLGMTETGFHAPPDTADRLAAMYNPTPGGGLFLSPAGDVSIWNKRPDFLSGGGGLVGSAADYHRFTRFLLGRGQLDGVRLLGPRTVDYMTVNQLPKPALADFRAQYFSATDNSGLGFGLGFSVVMDPVAGKVLSSAGQYAWGGAASTEFYVDPAEELTVMFFTQLLPSGTYQLRSQLRQLVHQAIID
jgi:CubicO group peptidase (beta-lactamase class C family)